MTRVAREVEFTEPDVVDWCYKSNDHNQLHLSKSEAADGPFGERIVPGMMVLDQVSGLLSQYGETVDGSVILANIVACRFRDPIPLDEEVLISVEESDEDQRFTYLDFEARCNGALAVHGTVSIALD